jgi:hypothetical protein
VTIPYFGRLLCLSLAAFFVAHLVLTVVVRSISGRAIAKARSMCAREGARLLFALRLAPAVVAGVIAGGLCAPSYLWLEPDAATEQIGVGCLVAALMAAACCIHGIARAVRAALRSSRYLRSCEQAIESDAPLLMLAGVFQPRLVVSRGVRRALTSEQLAVAVEHECAHGAAHDNLKRLLVLLTPDALPFVRSLTGLERGWARLAEWAADDRAVDGSRQRSLSLAAALVRVARMGASPSPRLATSLLGDGDDLSTRVERLLNGFPPGPQAKRPWPAMAVAVAVVALTVQPGTLVAVHRALEALAH